MLESERFSSSSPCCLIKKNMIHWSFTLWWIHVNRILYTAGKKRKLAIKKRDHKHKLHLQYVNNHLSSQHNKKRLEYLFCNVRLILQERQHTNAADSIRTLHVNIKEYKQRMAVSEWVSEWQHQSTCISLQVLTVASGRRSQQHIFKPGSRKKDAGPLKSIQSGTDMGFQWFCALITLWIGACISKIRSIAIYKRWAAKLTYVQHHRGKCCTELKRCS